MSTSVDSSSSSSLGNFFNTFTLCEEGLYPLSLHVLPLMAREDRITAFLYKNSLSQERIRQVSFCYFVPPKLEIVVPRRGNSVLHHPVGFIAIYMDCFKAGLRLPRFPFLTNILNYYQLALPQLAPNAVRTVIVFQFYCDYKVIRSSVSLFWRFFLLKSADSLGWYAFFFQRPSLKVKMPSKNADSKDKFQYFRLLVSSQVRCRLNLNRISNRLDDSIVIPGFDALE